MAACSNGPERHSRDDQIVATISLLHQALRSVDQIGDIPVIGARLQMLVDALGGELTTSPEIPVQVGSTLVPGRTKQ